MSLWYLHPAAMFINRAEEAFKNEQRKRYQMEKGAFSVSIGIVSSAGKKRK